MEQEAQVTRWTAAIRDELAAAQAKFGPMANAAEGAAVLQEEVDELWHEIKHGARDRINMRAEAIQVAAMAIRFVEDVCDGTAEDVLSWAGLHAHHGFPSPHAGYASFLTEMSRLWHSVSGNSEHRHARMTTDARAVALVALRFLVAFGEEA